MCSLSFSEAVWKKTISETPSERGELVALEDGTQMQVANRTTRVAPELVMDKWGFRVRKRDSLSLESREGRDGDDLVHGELGHGGIWRGVGLLFLILHALAVYTHFLFSPCLTSRNR